MARLIDDAAMLPRLIEGTTPLFITMPADVLSIADSSGIVSTAITQTGATHLTYAGSALPVEDVQRLYEQVDRERCSPIVAVGGGTVIDAAKIIAVALSNRLKDIGQLLDNPTNFANTIPMVCIPTTCGTGSEATHFAVVYRAGRKYSVAHQSMRPETTILDWHFLVALPAAIRDATVLDALSQAVESTWARGGTDESRGFAAAAIEHILKGLAATSEADRLQSLQIGSHLAGRAIDISKTTASHAISYPLTARFGIPHGIAVFLTLPGVAELNYRLGSRGGFPALFDLFGVDSIAAFAGRLRDIMSGMGFSLRLGDWRVTEQDIPGIAAESIVPGRSDNNPILIDETTVIELLQSTM